MDRFALSPLGCSSSANTQLGAITAISASLPASTSDLTASKYRAALPVPFNTTVDRLRAASEGELPAGICITRLTGPATVHLAPPAMRVLSWRLESRSAMSNGTASLAARPLQHPVTNVACVRVVSRRGCVAAVISPVCSPRTSRLPTASTAPPTGRSSLFLGVHTSTVPSAYCEQPLLAWVWRYCSRGERERYG
eukprot:gnl/Dysnectes_brevis/6365_a9821_316.p2 GENE.gnl/Dysnectes_brevis/6365_a9821_316~~gnl/Dysnectes_brevis/6365_a9821_316.p2  ORF type:complete len:195 (-),score=28.16 gnl/Dysnectes_brevis/6365_a9821_316:519-1103(-)